MQGTRVIPGMTQTMPGCRLYLCNGVNVVFENVNVMYVVTIIQIFSDDLIFVIYFLYPPV